MELGSLLLSPNSARNAITQIQQVYRSMIFIYAAPMGFSCIRLTDSDTGQKSNTGM